MRTRRGGWRRQEQAVFGVTSDERRESTGGGGECSDNVGGNVVARGATVNDARRAGGGRCYIRKGADDNGKRRERALDDGSAG